MVHQHELPQLCKFQQHCYRCIPQVICMLSMHILGVGETTTISQQQLTVCGVHYAILLLHLSVLGAALSLSPPS